MERYTLSNLFMVEGMKNNLSDYARLLKKNTKDLTFYDILNWYRWVVVLAKKKREIGEK
jgi:hypothetical protein